MSAMSCSSYAVSKGLKGALSTKKISTGKLDSQEHVQKFLGVVGKYGGLEAVQKFQKYNSQTDKVNLTHANLVVKTLIDAHPTLSERVIMGGFKIGKGFITMLHCSTIAKLA